MQVHQVMTQNVRYIATDTTIRTAAQKMRDLDTGFLPLGNSEQDKLQGVITDRDIAVRAVAEGKDPGRATVDQFKTDKVLYCYRDDELDTAARSMREQQVYRLIVLDNPAAKRLCGVISLGDIARHNEVDLAGETARSVAA